MPNWVYNSMRVTGNRDDLIAFAEKAAKQYETLWLSDRWVFDEKLGKNVEVPENERKVEQKLSEPSVLSFWNFVCPKEEDLPYYFGHKTKEEDLDDPNATKEEQMAKALTFSGSGWYDWNIRNWGTKWDAGNADRNVEDLSSIEENGELIYTFDTAWSIPVEIFTAIVEQHPELDFDFSGEEEQGWGAKFCSSDDDGDGVKSLVEVESWEIPSSHADYASRDNLDNCNCAHYEDESDWYKDCPRPEKEYRVVVKTTYLVTSGSAEQAWNFATENINSDTMLKLEDASERSVLVLDESDNKIYPSFSNLDLTSEN